MDREAFPGQDYQVDRDRRYDDVSICRRAYEQKECGDNGCRGLRLLEEKLLLDEESLFGILIHATGTCRGTSTPAPSQRTRFALSVTQRRSRRSSSAWYAFSQSTEQFPSGRSWRGTNWTTRDSSKLCEVARCVQKKMIKKLLFFMYTSIHHAHVLSASLRRPDVSRSFSALFRVRY